MFQWQAGEVAIGKELATLRLPPEDRYHDPKQSKFVLEEVWGNPPSELTLGMIFPADQGPASESWAVVLEYVEDGHVSDDDAEEIDYDELLEDMQSGTKEENEQRAKLGFPAVDLVGWATKPHYDAAARKLYWAKELRFAAAPVNTLNYDVRVLGRKGVLSMNAVATIEQLADVEQGMKSVLAAIEFDPGNRYEDYDSSVDQLAAYGLGGLVAGGLALKAGLFKGLWLLILAAKKFIILGLAAIGAFFAKVFKRKRPAESAAP